jgi:peroxiredoxin
MGDPYDDAIAAARALAAPLDARLGMARDACRLILPEYDAALDAFVARLERAEAGRFAPKPGEPFPDFALPDDEGRLWRMDALRAEGPVVVALHRGGWCDFCQINLAALAEALPRLRAAGGSLVAVAPQRAAWAARHRAEAGAEFPMLADMGCAVATALGLTVLLDETLRGLLLEFGIDLAHTNGDDGLTIPIPATFVVRRDGVVAARHLDPDPRRRMDIEAMIAAVAACA